MGKKQTKTRREFIKQSAVATAGVSMALGSFPSPTVKKVLGANDKIRMGFIGIGNRGSQLLEAFMSNQDVEVAALCDVYEPYLLRDRSKVSEKSIKLLGGRIPRLGEKFENKPKTFRDFRELLDNKDIDAVCIATPDHWHAIQTIETLAAGKDIYVEKPLTITLLEGRKMVEAHSRTNRIVQVGLNRRGSDIYQKLAKEIQNGRIGKVVTARAFRISNMYPKGIGKLQPEDPPAGLNWDMWLGPRAKRPFQYNMAPYFFRWWSDYSTQMGNWGVHYMDVIRWLAGETAPVAVSAHGGHFFVDDDRDIPDTMEVTFEFKSGMLLKFGIYEASSGGGIPDGEIEIAGQKGTLRVRQNGYKIIPSQAGQFQDWDKLIEPEESTIEANLQYDSENSTYNLVRNFLDCIKSRKTPWCPLEEGHRSTSFAHLANIALKTKKRLEWDPVRERITNDEAANSHLFYEYRSPWKLV
jgi:predicted dehydrogenase